MCTTAKVPLMPETATTPSRTHSVRWNGLEWSRIVEAAAVLAARTGLKVGAHDVIRAGTMEKVERTLSEAA